MLSAQSIRLRSIPAWAGETLVCPRPPSRDMVYPRVGGGNPPPEPEAPRKWGLSPRGRGKPSVDRRHHKSRGSIPAWAGETSDGGGRVRRSGVYPRVGGGNEGMTPPGRSVMGLSPRGRGKLVFHAHRHGRDGSIPAWAGETHGREPTISSSEVYPRVGGGNVRLQDRDQLSDGLSPRGRGKLGSAPRLGASHRSIPAWAGETSIVSDCSSSEKVYPRVGGGNSPAPSESVFDLGLSPRGRGKPRRRPDSGSGEGSIPAWAGETRRRRRRPRRRTVYPRVGGGNWQ